MSAYNYQIVKRHSGRLHWRRRILHTVSMDASKPDISGANRSSKFGTKLDALKADTYFTSADISTLPYANGIVV